MHSPFKKPKSKEGDINQQLSNTIYIKVTKKTHNHESPKKNGDGTIKKCIELFKQEADPKVLIRLEESLRGQEEYHGYYIKNFLPILKDEVIKSEALAVSTVFGNGIEQSQRPQTKRGKIVKTILDITNRSSDKDSKIEEQPINSIKEEIPVSSTGMTENNVESPMTQDQTQQELESLTKEEVCVSESESGINSPGLASSSRRSSVSSILSSAGENNNLQKENENQMQPEQAVEEEPQVSSQCLTLGSREKESMDPNSQTTQMTGSQAKDPIQPKEKKDRENATPIVQKPPVNEKKGEDTPLKKQPNNRNLHVALVAGCALSTIGCIVAGAMTSGLVGAGLLAMAAVFAIAAVAELHSNFLSSKLTSINVSPLVDDKELTAL